MLDQRAHRIAVAQSLVRVAHVEMGIERDQPDFLQRQSNPEHARPGHRIVAADEQSEIMERIAELNRVADRRGSLFDREALQIDIPAVRDMGPQFAARLHIVTADAPQGLTEQLRRKIAIARRHGSGRERRADQSDGRAFFLADDQLGQIGPAAHALTLTAVLA